MMKLKRSLKLQVNVAQPSLLNPGKYGKKIGTVSINLSLATVIFKLTNLE